MLPSVLYCGKTAFEKLSEGERVMVTTSRNPVQPGQTFTVVKMDRVGRATNESVRVTVQDETPASTAWTGGPSMSIWVIRQPKAENEPSRG